MAFDIKGKLHKVFDRKAVSDRFTKCDFVVEMEDGKYPQLVSFQIVNDKIAQLDGLNVGDEVTVTFNVRGREWTSPSREVKYFNTLDAWRVQATKETKRGSAREPDAGFGDSPADDGLPFATSEMSRDVNPIARVLR